METELKINKDSDQILAFEGAEQVGLIDFTFEGNILDEHAGEGVSCQL